MKVTDDRQDDKIVELTRVPFIAEAVAIRQDLGRIGISATVFESDAGGWAPHFGIEQGHRVMVFSRDLEKARQLLSEAGGQLPIDELAHAPTVKKHLRHPGDA